MIIFKNENMLAIMYTKIVLTLPVEGMILWKVRRAQPMWLSGWVLTYKSGDHSSIPSPGTGYGLDPQ